MVGLDDRTVTRCCFASVHVNVHLNVWPEDVVVFNVVLLFPSLILF